MAACGFGAMRVITKFAEGSFEQDAYIEKIDNALSVYWGYHSKYDASDAKYCFVLSEMDRDEFKDTYGIDAMEFTHGDDSYVDSWNSEDTVTVAEYFVKEPKKKKLYQLEDGTVVEKLAKGQKAVKEREEETYIIKWYLLSGNAVLDEKVWPGKKYIPIIPIKGKEVNVGGKPIIRGLIRNAKEPAMMYNYWTSSNTETVALAPKFPYIATAKQIEGHEDMWDNFQKRNASYLLTNADEKAPGWPQRQAPPQASSAMVQQIQMADQEIRDTTGLQKASLGMQSNERSGRAIMERKREGDTGSFAFIDNLARSITYLGRVLLDIAPAILDTERIIRLGMEDDLQRFVKINAAMEDGGIFNDVTMGQYDIVVTVGPSFSTQRTEARQSMQEFLQYNPDAAALIGDLYAKSMDWPGAEELADRLSFMLPPELKEQKAIEDAKNRGEAPPPPKQQPPPDPLFIAKLEEEKFKIQEMQITNEQEMIKVEQEKIKLEQMKVDLETSIGTSNEAIRKMVEDIIKEKSQSQNISQPTPTLDIPNSQQLNVPPPMTFEEFTEARGQNPQPELTQEGELNEQM